MNKIYTILGLLLIMASGVSANLCDDAINDGLWVSNPELFDIYEDGVTDLSDLILFSENRMDDHWCNILLDVYYRETGDARNQRSLTEMSRVSFTDVQGKSVYSPHRFYIDRNAYAIDLVWERHWYDRWFPSDDFEMIVYDRHFDVLFSKKTDDLIGSFDLDGETVEYRIREGNNIALKKITLELEE